jgi:FAD/FMN-containing dehydrogenase
MTTLPPRDALGFFHPQHEADVSALVRWARDHRRTVRVRGAGHSVPAAIHTDAQIGRAHV